MSARARKRFGQHFLTSGDIVEQIVAAIAPRAGETIVEIGPGRAAITAPLAQCATALHAIELDRDLVAELENRFRDYENVTIHEADALQFDFSSLGGAIRLVGNLPYNVSTPLLFHLLLFENVIIDMHFMLQKELVDRMAAMPGNKDYGRLTIMLGCRMEVVPLFTVPAESFSPPPKVTSAFVRMRPLTHKTFDIADPRMLEQIVKQAFSRRRKTLRNALKGLVGERDMLAAGLDPAARPEQVPVSGWVTLANRLAGQK